MYEFNLKPKKEATQLLDQIVEKAAKELPGIDTMSMLMDLECLHMNGCPLRLKEFLHGADIHFFHDIFGIRKHLDRNTGKLEDCFLPRFAL